MKGGGARLWQSLLAWGPRRRISLATAAPAGRRGTSAARPGPARASLAWPPSTCTEPELLELLVPLVPLVPLVLLVPLVPLVPLVLLELLEL